MFAVKVSVSACVMALALVACGGGGGGGDSAPASASGSSAAGSSQSSAQASSSASSATSGTAGSSSSSSASPPSLSSPDTGSTAQTGGDLEGIWTNANGLATFIAPDGALFDGTDTNLRGTISFATGNWQLGANTTSSGLQTAVGSGVYSAHETWSGDITIGSQTAKAVAFTYNRDNALAVTQQSLVGTWGPGANINADGNFRVSMYNGSCTYAGTVRQYSPNTGKNLFAITIDVLDVDGTCSTAGEGYYGLAAIRVLDSGARLFEYHTVRPNQTNKALTLNAYWDAL